jgi:tetratricopeptide (TPR) repeat protein
LEEGCSLRVQGEIALETGRAAEAATPLTESVRVLEDVADEYELARSRFSLARAYAGAGQRAEALAQIEQAVAVFERLEAAMDLTAARRLREALGPGSEGP